MAEERTSRIANSEVLPLFPTFVWKCQLQPEVYKPINETILTELDALRQSLPELKPGQAWQSMHSLHRLPEFDVLVSCIEDSTRSVLEFLKIGYDAFEITACWANINAKDTPHKMHHHPNNFLSGVYYVQTQEGADTINFHDPRQQTGIIRPPVTQLTAMNTDQAVVRVSDGTLIAFPAWLPHSVDPNISARERISISFNIMFSSFTKGITKPLWGSE